MSFALREIQDQRQALRILAGLVQKAIDNPLVVSTARKIVSRCPARDDECELVAIYEAVKHGTPEVKALAKGFRYVADPIQTDFFSGAERLLKECADGNCSGDCDEHGVLAAALAGAIGFPVGLRIWGPTANGDFEHVYGVAGYPKQEASNDPREWLGMDTTVPSAYVGWDPPSGRWATAIAVAPME